MAGALALVLWMAAATAMIAGPLSFPPREALHWLPFVAGLGVALHLLRGRSGRAYGAGLMLAGIGTARVLLESRLQNAWSAVEGPLPVVGTGLLLGLQALFHDMLVRTGPARQRAGLLCLIAGCASLALGLTGSIKLAMLGGSLALALAVVLALAWALPKLELTQGAAPVASLSLGTLLLVGVCYSDLPWESAMLLGLAPRAALHTQGWKSLGVTLLMGGMAVAVAIWIGWNPSRN